MRLNKEITSLEIADQLGFEHLGVSQKIRKVVPLNKLSPGAISFARDKVISTETGVVIASSEIQNSNITTLNTKNPRLGFIRLMNFLLNKGYLLKEEQTPVIGRNCKIHPKAIIEPNTVIGENCIIRAGAIIKSGSQIGDEVIIRENAVIGADGFGYEKDEEGIPIHFPHFAGVIIEDKVEIGANSVVCEGALTPTKIGYASKVNASTLIGHNVQIGKYSYIHAGVVASGGCTIGDHCWIGTNATILEKRVIKHNALIGSATVVNKNIEANKKVVGNPMRVIGDIS
jgi:UDP-3-O-[3-hydroxymyristoyl] glucosamine N-acyltransferase